MTMKLCKDCKHYEPSRNGLNARDYSRCTLYRMEPDPSPVTGEPGPAGFCNSQRTTDLATCCGPEGKGWEPAAVTEPEQAAA